GPGYSKCVEPLQYAAAVGVTMRPVSVRQVAVAMAFGLLGTAIGLCIDAAISYWRKDWSNPLGVVLVVGLASFSGIIPLLQEMRVSKKGETTQRSQLPHTAPRYKLPWSPQYLWESIWNDQRYIDISRINPKQLSKGPTGTDPAELLYLSPMSVRVPAFLAIIVLMVVLGGAVTLAIGERDAGGWLTGNEDGVEVLMAEKSAQAGPLTLNIHSVRLTAHFTRVEMSVENRSSE